MAAMSEQFVTFEYDDAEAQRLDKILLAYLEGFSRTRLQGLIGDGYVMVNGHLALKAGHKIEAPALIEVRIPPSLPTSLEAEPIPLEIIYEDQRLMVVNKPAGMVVHPAAGHASGTLVNAALAHDPSMEGIGGERRPGVVHRLDKDTSGLILLAKDERMHHYLQDQFRLRKVKKEYLAMVDGAPPTPSGRIEAPVGRDVKDRKRMAVISSEKGRDAVSEYNSLETFRAHTYLSVRPVTGRTHQIRLHLAFIGCPVVGDTVYGKAKPSLPVRRQFLHAARLRLQLPEEENESSFHAPLPDDLLQVLNQLRLQ
jgi:23S rRNA pseudouridine1911/1915/1917 synthase